MKENKNKVLTEEEVRGWLSKANLSQLNIFDDRNAIISRLCKELLKAWGKNPYATQ